MFEEVFGEVLMLLMICSGQPHLPQDLIPPFDLGWRQSRSFPAFQELY